MKLNLEINNRTKIRLDESFIRHAVLTAIKESGCQLLNDRNVKISLALVSKNEIRKLNHVYRKINKTTDILSFSEYKNQVDLKKERKSAIFLGELVICPDDIKNYAKKNSLDFKKELVKVAEHGTLHLLGFIHGQRMFLIQEGISSKKIYARKRNA